MLRDETLDFNRDDHLDEVIAAYLESTHAGTEPDRGAILARHPDLATDLRQFFTDRDRFELLAERVRTAVTAVPPVGSLLRYFGDYELLEEIARGGMGVVYKARQASLNRAVALKMILIGQLASATDLRRFRSEAEAAGNLDHPNIVPIYEVGEHQGQHYFSMRLIEGGSLAQHMPRLRSDARKADRLIAIVARAVHHAHQRGILHRDLKPANILLDENDEPHVTDFGLAKQITSGGKLTQSGAIVGTPSYMAPEQAQGEKGLTTAVDVYGLGALLYELLTGRPPHQAETPMDTLLDVMERDPATPRSLDPQVDRDLETITLKCLAREPGRRYKSAEALAEDLERWLAGEPIQARRTRAWERALKWARRRPAIAALTTLLFICVASAFQGIFYHWRSAEAARSDALQKADDEKKARHKAEDERDAKQKALIQVKTERDAKEKALRRAEGLRLTAQSSASLPTNPGLALLLAIEGAQRAPGLLANNSLLAALEACHEQRTLPGHEWEARSAEFSPDGRRVLTVDAAGRVRIWNAATGDALTFKASHPMARMYARFSPDGRYVVTTYDGGTVECGKRIYTDRVVRIWDAASGKLHQILRGHTSRVVSAAFSPDGKRLVTASYDRTARVWDVAMGKLLFALPEQRSSLLDAQFSADGTRLLTVCSNLRHVRDVDRQRPANPQEEVDPAEIHPKDTGGGMGMSGGVHPAQDTVLGRLWDGVTGKELAVLKDTIVDPITLHYLEVIFGAFSPDGRRVLIVTREIIPNPAGKGPRYIEAGMIRGFDRDGKDVNTFPMNALETNTLPIRAVAVSPDGQRVVTTTGKLAHLWDIFSPGKLCTFKGHQRPITAAQFSPDGRTILTASEDRTTRIWDATGEEVAVFRGHEQSINTATFSRDGQQVVTAGKDQTARIWQMQPAREFAVRMHGHKGSVLSVAMSADNQRVVTGSKDGTTRIWDAATGKQLHVLKGLSQLGDLPVRKEILGEVRTVLFSPDGRWVLTAAHDEKARVNLGKGEEDIPFTPVRLWNAKTGEEVFAFPGLDSAVERVEFSPDGRFVLTLETGEVRRGIYISGTGGRTMSGGENGKKTTVRVWEVAARKQIAAWETAEGPITWAAFSPGGRRVVTAANTLTMEGGRVEKPPSIALWETTTGKKLRTLPEWGADHPYVQFGPDGRSLLSLSHSQVRIWDAETGKERRAFKGPWSSFARFSQDSRWVLTVSPYEGPSLWEIETNKVVPLKGHQLVVHWAACSPDGRLMATASEDETARIWETATGKEVYTLTGHQGAVHRVAFSPDGRRVVTASEDGTARVWLIDPLPTALRHKPRELTEPERKRFEIAAAANP
jgi:WD40 repeat protein